MRSRHGCGNTYLWKHPHLAEHGHPAAQPRREPVHLPPQHHINSSHGHINSSHGHGRTAAWCTVQSIDELVVPLQIELINALSLSRARARAA
jgi:hypothetical protein